MSDNNNVTGIFDKPKKDSDDTEEMSFEDIMKRNEDNKKRLAEARRKANKAVTRSYRLKK